MRNKLIILEGPDGVGKSTQAKIITEALQAARVSQPSVDNCVGYIRAEAKSLKHITEFERQLLITISHTLDALSKFDGKINVVMERSYISVLIYFLCQYMMVTFFVWVVWSYSAASVYGVALDEQRLCSSFCTCYFLLVCDPNLL